MARRRQGPLERSTRALVRDMGKLTARQKVTAEQAFMLARLGDDEADASKAASLSRELRQVVATLTPAASPMPRPQQGEPHHDPVQAAQDQLAKRRRDREARGG